MTDSPAKGARRGLVAAAGVGAVAIISLFVGRTFGLSASAFTGLLGAVVPLALGLLFALNQPLAQAGFTRSPRVDLVASAALFVAAAVQAGLTLRAEPAPPSLQMRGRAVVSDSLGFRLELPDAWQVTTAPVSGLVSVREPASDTVLSAMAVVAGDPGETLDDLLTAVLESQRESLRPLARPAVGRLGRLPARVVRVAGRHDDARVMRASIARQGPYAILVTCTVPARAEPDFSACDRLLDERLSVP